MTDFSTNRPPSVAASAPGRAEMPYLGVALPTTGAAGPDGLLAYIEACADAAGVAGVSLLLLAGRHGPAAQVQNVPMVSYLAGRVSAVPLAALFLTEAWPPGLLAEQAATLATLTARVGNEFVPVLASGRPGAVTPASPDRAPAEAADLALDALVAAGLDPWIASERGRALRRASRAGGWIANAVYDDTELAAQLRAVGSVPNRAVRRDVMCKDDRDEAREEARALLASGYRTGMLPEHVIASDPAGCAAGIRHYGGLGFTHVLIRPMASDPDVAAETIVAVAAALQRDSGSA